MSAPPRPAAMQTTRRRVTPRANGDRVVAIRPKPAPRRVCRAPKTRLVTTRVKGKKVMRRVVVRAKPTFRMVRGKRVKVPGKVLTRIIPCPVPVQKPDQRYTAARPVPVAPDALSVGDAERLMWRAGFGPRPGDAARLSTLGRAGAVASLVRPSGPATLTGAAPMVDGAPLAPADARLHDHLYWLDRMVRTDQPLVERMALIWHDWFATSNDTVNQQQLMLDQIDLFRAKGLGSFLDLALSVTVDPAMLVWLNGDQNRKGRPNENYARELMELFTLGADRGAYTETDVRELARALTGFKSSFSNEQGHFGFTYDAARHDAGVKTIFGQSGAFTWDEGVRLCVTHPLHPSFFVAKLWGYFVAAPPDPATAAALEGLYVRSAFQILPVVEAILRHPALTAAAGPRFVKPPIVFAAGAMRASGRFVDQIALGDLADGSGQRLGYPPDVSGWDDEAWLDTSTVRGRWSLANEILRPFAVPYDGYDAAEDAATAVARARASLGDPPLAPDTLAALNRFAAGAISTDPRRQSRDRAMRQSALRHLILVSPDYQVS